MLSTYQPGHPIKEVGGAIQGGVSVVMHSPSDLETVASVCAPAGTSTAPMHALYGLLNTPDLQESATPRAAGIPHWAETDPDAFEHAGRALIAACSCVQDLWLGAQDEGEFTAVLTVAEPAGEMRIDLNVDQPGLVFHRGSLLATLVSGPLSVFGWSLGLFSGRGIGASTRAKRMMEDFRANALARTGTQNLDRLDNLPPHFLEGKAAVIVLLHGLLSTDAGVFDGLLHFLRADPAFADCAIVGWPHNTMAGIRDNAVELLPLFARSIGIEGPNIAFVCHSRGGLVARAAAVELCEANPKSLGKLKACVTFGTPHNGSPLAEAPGDLLGKVVAIQAFRGGNGFLSLSDALHFVHRQASIQGVLDLRPLGAGGDFLKDLIPREAKFAPDGAERALPILAVGGKAAETGYFAELSRRALAGGDNDLIVETSSSATRSSTRQVVTRCNHFEYFRSSLAQADTFEPAAGFLKQHLALERESPKADHFFVETQNDITVKGIRLKKRHKNYTDAKPAAAP